ncbi:MAG: hypothetical protein QM776_12820 [Rhodocyclaceae bacterium]
MKCFVMIVVLMLAPGLVQAESLVPLLDADVAPGCGCSFTRLGVREAPLLRWSSEGKKKSVIRVGSKPQTLDLRQEKYIPEREGSPRPNDRFVLHASNGDWNIQAVMTAVGGACKGKSKSCSLTRYEGNLVVLEGGRNRSTVPAAGICGCE